MSPDSDENPSDPKPSDPKRWTPDRADDPSPAEPVGLREIGSATGSSRQSAAIIELTKEFEGSTAVLLTEYRGLTVAQLKQLRNNIREDANYAVVKNTLAKIAADKAGFEDLDDKFEGPSAIAFVHGDFVATAKALRDFAKANPLLVIKGGIFEGNAISADEVNMYASLESREVLLAKLAGVMKAPLAKAVRAVDALRERREEVG